mmetsp:Transcript_29889/g.84211  ORF Transcript_29889/g.84211 Transcript_29889/m.84211 type:complete len:208 (+) Transcript_29889:159-782(+)
MPRQRLARLWARGAPGGAPMTPNLTPGTCGHAAATVGPVVESGGAGWRTDGRQLVIAPPLLRWARLHPQEACITILPTFTPQFSGRHPPARPGSMPSSSTRMCGASHLAAPPRSELACLLGTSGLAASRAGGPCGTAGSCAGREAAPSGVDSAAGLGCASPAHSALDPVSSRPGCPGSNRVSFLVTGWRRNGKQQHESPVPPAHGIV